MGQKLTLKKRNLIYESCIRAGKAVSGAKAFAIKSRVDELYHVYSKTVKNVSGFGVEMSQKGTEPVNRYKAMKRRAQE